MRYAALAALALLPAALLPARAQRPENLPDLDVTYIERTPRYPGYMLSYDLPGKQGVPIVVDNRTRKPLTPAQAKAVKRWPAAGETVLFTAHVRNVGSAPAPSWEFEWRIDGRRVAAGRVEGPQDAGEERTAALRWRWVPGRHTVTFAADPLYKVRDQLLANNARTDATDAWSLIWAVDRVTYESFGKVRNFVGSRSFEDWAQWHIDHMNTLFDRSPTPWSLQTATGPAPTPEQAKLRRELRTRPKPRVRCDRIVVVDSTDGLWKSVLGEGAEPLDAGYDGGWSFGRREDCTEWAANVDWGLIHEWGHQLGLTDLYALDRAGFMNNVADANGDPLLIGHMSSQVGFMMHGHGPTTFSPLCMGALITQQGRRRGYYGDHYYCIPKTCVLRVLDSEGRPVPGARVAFWQDKDNAYAGKPVFQGTTDAAGQFTMPNRPAPHITTELGYTQRDNPFGQVNVVGPGDVFLIRIEARGQVEYTWLDIAEVVLAYWGGDPDRGVFDRKTHIPSPRALPAPKTLTAAIDRDTVKLEWAPVAGANTYVVYTAGPDEYLYKKAATVPSSATTWSGPLGPGLQRIAVVAADSRGRESGFSPVAGAMHLVRPFGIAVAPDGRRYVRDPQYGQQVLQKPDGNTVGLVGSVHYHFEGSYDIAIDGRGRILTAKWGDGYDPRPGFKVQKPNLDLDFAHLVPEGSGQDQCRQPMGICADPRGHIFLSDTGNDRVLEFDEAGAFLRVIGAGDVRVPMKVACDNEGRLYVADSGHNRIAIFKRAEDGSFAFEREIKEATFKEPVYVMVDDRGRIYASTNRNAATYLFTPDGKVAWKYNGTPDDPITAPRGLALDGKGNLLIVDEATKRVLTVKAPE